MNLKTPPALNLLVYLLIFFWLASLFYFFVISVPLPVIIGSDFTPFLTGARIIRQGKANLLYDIQTQIATQQEIIKPFWPVTNTNESSVLLNPFKNPPLVGLMLLPIAHLPLTYSYRIFAAFNLLLLFFFIFLIKSSFKSPRKYSALLLLPLVYAPIIQTVGLGQISLILSIVLLFVYNLLAANQPFAVGLVSGFLFLKPQYLTLMPFLFLLIANKRRFLSGFLLTFSSLFLLSISIIGIEGLVRYPAFLASTENPRFCYRPNETFSLNSLLSIPTLSLTLPQILIINGLLYALFLVLFCKRYQKISLGQSFSVAIMFSLLFSVHVLSQDLLFLLIPGYLIIDYFVTQDKNKEVLGVILFLALISLLALHLKGSLALFPLSIPPVFFLFYQPKSKLIPSTFKKKFKPLFLTCSLIFAISLFWLRGIILLDPDFGWHLRLGKIIMASGIPKTDPFSYTMPSYPFVDHEWLTNTVIAKLHPILGQIGLAGIYSILAFLAIIASISNPLSHRKSFKKSEYYLSLVPLMLGACTLLDYFGIRPQVISWLFLAIFLHPLLNPSAWEKWHWALPVFLIIWANLHGSFAVGIVTLFLVVFSRSWKEKKLWLNGLIIFALSLLATFVNPHRTRLWWEVWQQVSDTSLRWTIVEWHPSILFFQPSLAALATLSTVLVLKYRKKFKLEELGLYFFFLLQGISSLRHVPLWVVVCLPMVTTALRWFGEEIKSIKGATLRFKKVYRYAIIGTIILAIPQAGLSLLGANSLSEERYYPKKAVAFLKSNPPKGRVFSQYGWGGYLIWKFPEKKVFIDGRMPSWRWESASPQESGYVMKDHQKITRGEISYLPYFEKYGINTILWPAPDQKEFAKPWQKKLINFLSRFSKKEEGFDFLVQLERDGWQKTYHDSVAVVFQNNTFHNTKE